MKKLIIFIGLLFIMVFPSCEEDYFCNGEITIVNSKSSDYWISVSNDDGSYAFEFELLGGDYRVLKKLDAGVYTIIAEKEGAILKGLTTKTTTITLNCGEKKLGL
ncbi:MAG: hypothetical protein PUG15_07270 [Bacteroidales bacterium]|nr:hypothetical protein [Bacteroidales bacterium]